MPELPEVETTRRGIIEHIQRQTVGEVIVRQSQLRWPIPREIQSVLRGQTIENVTRRGKYLLLETAAGTLLIHLGMSGSLRILEKKIAPQKHDHVDIVFTNKKYLRYTDPRRFGAVLWVTGDPLQHSLLATLGPEPLTHDFTAAYLFTQSRQRKVAVKQFIMDSHVVVGVGNIYATEALFTAKIHPQMAAGKLTEIACKELVTAIKKILTSAIRQGGTTLRDFSQSDGKPGYFALKLQAYGRGNLPCLRCKTLLKEIRLGQRSTVFCPRCQ